MEQVYELLNLTVKKYDREVQFSLIITEPN